MRRIVSALLVVVALAVFAPAASARSGESQKVSKARDLVTIRKCDAFHYDGHSPTRQVCRALVRASATTGLPRAWVSNPSFLKLLRHESGYSKNAVNPSSKACGLFQRLMMYPKPPCPWKLSGVGTTHQTVHSTAHTQAVNGLGYIHGRYGTPDAAWAFWQLHRYY